jgi:hypothetical protein
MAPLLSWFQNGVWGLKLLFTWGFDRGCCWGGVFVLAEENCHNDFWETTWGASI